MKGGDHFIHFYTYETWGRSSGKAAWCKRHFVSSAAMHMKRQIRAQLFDSMRVFHMPLGSAEKPFVEARCSDSQAPGTPTKSGTPLFLLSDNAVLLPVVVHPGSTMLGRKWSDTSSAAEWALFHSLT